MTPKATAAATAAALIALVLLVGTAAYLGVREEPEPPPTTTTTSTTTTTVPFEVFADAIARQLQGNLEVAITRGESLCVANAMLGVLPPDDLERLAQLPAPFAALDQATKDQLVRGVVQCVPPESAAALLGTTSETAPPVELPDEG